MHPIDQRLADLGLTLPPPTPPGGSYQPAVIRGDMLSLAAQFPIEPGRPASASPYRGRLGDTLSTEQGVAAARLAALNAISRMRHALGGFDRLVGLRHVDAMLLTTTAFADHPRVVDGASDLFNDVLGEAGMHTRSLCGVASLPLSLCVELVVAAEVR